MIERYGFLLHLSTDKPKAIFKAFKRRGPKSLLYFFLTQPFTPFSPLYKRSELFYELIVRLKSSIFAPL